IRFDAPTVLRIQAKVEIAPVRWIGLALNVGGRSAQEKIDEVASRFTDAPVYGGTEEEVAVGYVGEVFFILVVVILSAEFEGMPPHHFAEIVEHLIDVFEQLIRPARHTDGIVIEIGFRDALDG